MAAFLISWIQCKKKFYQIGFKIIFVLNTGKKKLHHSNIAGERTVTNEYEYEFYLLHKYTLTG